MKIGDKTFMNLQEAVGWLLENNALPFQSTANYVANTEIALSTLVAPSPAKVRVGSLIFFADSKVSTVVGVTSNSFIVSDQYNDLVDDIVYVSNVAINASGHLIVTLSNGDNIDAGLIKQINNFSINGSQHLIANYNDGTSTDLGAIFSGNISISGNLSVSGNTTITGGLSANAITGDSIIESMNGYGFEKGTDTANTTLEFVYAGACKNGNKLTLVLAVNATKINDDTGLVLGKFEVPTAVFSSLYSVLIAGSNYLINTKGIAVSHVNAGKTEFNYYISKAGGKLWFVVNSTQPLPTDKEYIRIECTFLLSENLAS